MSPAAVVGAARDRAHALHRHFEWRDQIAAEQYRLDQARTLIRVIRVIDDQGEDPTPGIAFLSVKANGGHNYYTKSAVAASVQFGHRVAAGRTGLACVGETLQRNSRHLPQRA